MILQKSISLVTAITILSTSVAQAEDGLLSDIKPPQQASEYIFRSTQKESLISVQLMGAVNKPGIYYVPANTDLLKLITLAGGQTTSGDVSEVLVRKQEPKAWNEVQSKAINEYQGAYEVNAEKIIKYGGARQLKLAQDDFVYVPQRSTWVSPEATKTITVVSLVAGIVLSGLLIQRYSDHK